MSADARDKVDGAAPNAQLDDLLAQERRGLELDLRVAAPASVLAYNPATQRADVQLAFLPVLFVDDEEVPQPPIVCPQVPVLNYGGSLGYVAPPLVPGDTGLVVFADRCMAQWLLAGGSADPINGRTHALGDGIFIPGVRATPDVIVPPPSPTALVIEGPAVNGIQLGATATQHLVIAETLHAYLVAAITAAATAPLDGGATFKAALLAYLGANPFTSYMTTKVTAE